MAEDSSGTSQPSPPAVRSGPVLVPQASLLGKPDIALSRSVMTAGSRESCRIHLVSRSISQFHALFVNSSGTVAVLDLASRTGVLVNAKTVKYAELKNGDLVQLGKFVFRFRAPRPEAVAAPPEPAVLDLPGDLPVSLAARMLIVGRRETCDLPLTDDIDVSTLHAVLFQHDGHWIIRDLDSRTGTRLNGIRTHQAKLAFGDSIKIGKTTFTFSPAIDVMQTPVEDEPARDRAGPLLEPIEEPAVPAVSSVAAVSPAAAPEDVAEQSPAPLGNAFDLESLPLDFPDLDAAAVASAESKSAPTPLQIGSEPDAIEFEPFPLEMPDAPTSYAAVNRPFVAESPPEPDATEVAPLEVSATINTELPVEPEVPAISSVEPTIPPEPATFPASAAEDAVPAEPDADDRVKPHAGGLDVGSAATFDLPLELDLSEQPNFGSVTGDTDPTAATNAVEHASPTAPAETQPVPPLDEPIDFADAVTEAVSLDASESTDQIVAEAAPAAEPLAINGDGPVSAPAIDELPPPVLTEAAASPPPLVQSPEEAAATVEDSSKPAPVSTESDTVDFGEPLSPEPQPVRKRTIKKAVEPKSKPAPKPVRGGRKKSVTPVIMDVVETMATDPVPELPVVDGGALLPEVAAAMELADGLPPVESIDAGAMLGITAARPDEPTLTMTESMPATAHDHRVAVTVSDIDTGEPVDTRDMARPADDDVVITTSTGLITEQLLVETDTDLVPAEFEPRAADAAAVHEPSDLLDEPTSLHAAASGSFADLADLSDDEEFVAIPEPEPTDIDLAAVGAWPAEDTLLDVPAEDAPDASPSTDDTALIEFGAEGQSLDVDGDIGGDGAAVSGDIGGDGAAVSDEAVSVEPVADEPPPDTADVEPPAIDSGAEPVEAAVDEPPVLAPGELAPTFESMMLGDHLQDPTETPGRSGPPLFGFDFGAASFLGGMPLRVQSPTAGGTGRAVDAKAPAPPQPVSPQSASAPPSSVPPAAAVAEFTTDPSQPTQPPMATAPAALVDLDESSLLSYDEPSVPMQSQRSAVVNLDEPALTAFDDAIRLPAAARSTDDQTLTSTTARPAINTLADEVAIPPLVSRSAEEQAPSRKSLTTAFDGLASGLGAAAGNIDVFSQMAPPIHDELFGSRGDDPAHVVLPNQQPEIPPSAPRRDPPLQIPPIDRAGPAKPAAAPAGDQDQAYAEEDDSPRPRRDRYFSDAPGRFARLPTLALLMLLCLIAAGMMIFFFLPPPIDVVGTLTFANLGKQTVSTQRQFAVIQVQRLESGGVRNIARSIAANKLVGNGFLDDDMEYARVTANADWDGDVMTLHQTTTDEYAARIRMSALLEALSHQDADLNDSLAKARAAATAAHDAVAAQQEVISRIRADRETQVRIGDSAPRTEDVAVLERKADQLDAAWVAAKTRRADAQLILDKLRQMDPAAATDPRDDPLLAELRAHQQQADVRLAVARVSAAKASPTSPAPDTDLSALVTDVDQTRVAIQHRMGVLSAEIKQTPEQRIMSRQSAIEAQSVKLATLQAAEADAASAAQTAAVAARDQHALLDAGRMASIQVEALIQNQEAADQRLKELSADEAAKDAAVNLCVQVASAPKVDTKPGRDIRPVTGAFAGGAILLLFGTIAAVSMRPLPPPPSMPTAAAVPAAPIPVFGANRKPRSESRRPQDSPSPRPDPASRT